MGIIDKENLQFVLGVLKEENAYCMNCGDKILNDKYSGGYKPGAFWQDEVASFLCRECVDHSDLHNIGALIGDAIMSGMTRLKKRMHKNYYSSEYPTKKVDDILRRIEIAIKDAIIYKLWYFMREKDNPDD